MKIALLLMGNNIMLSHQQHIKSAVSAIFTWLTTTPELSSKIRFQNKQTILGVASTEECDEEEGLEEDDANEDRHLLDELDASRGLATLSVSCVQGYKSAILYY